MTKPRIPIFRLSFDEEFRREFREGCERILDEAFLTNHTYVRAFEEDFQKFSNARHALAVANGTAALEVALRAVGVEGKEVLLPTNTFIATAVAVLNAGGIPRPLDIEPEYFGLSAEEVEEHLTKNTGAVICVHIGGLISPQINRIAELCQNNNVALIEDCAHAHGSTLEGTQAGNFGQAGTFSFFTTKVLTTGEGGLTTFNDPDLHEKARSIRQFGMDPENPISHVRAGSNFKLGEFQALMGTLELKRADRRIGQRQAIAARYQKNLAGSSWKAIAAPVGGTSSHYKQIVIAPVPRPKVKEHLEANGVALTGGVYNIPLHRQPVYAGKFEDARFPAANRFCETHICPPCYPELTMDEVDTVCQLLLDLCS